ncbi:hypothetical protein CW744_10115 [Staphylococcus xylosus]|uniref:hypothetical protein n=1 Tax=Staphylococcus xylosus TaxID=1288 RepID=UPI000C324F1B|nr:hypothetical protein [Staphylococcus xylosus]PKI04535.1 hypothetical protein CW744_10115 [Staphylococcus xylosus]
MKQKNIQPNSKLFKTMFPITALIHLFFIGLSIQNILSKDDVVATCLSIFSLMVFTSMLTLVVNKYIEYRKQNN